MADNVNDSRRQAMEIVETPGNTAGKDMRDTGEQNQRDRAERSATAWLLTLALAVERGDLDREAEARRELARLGVRVTWPRARRKAAAADPESPHKAEGCRLDIVLSRADLHALAEKIGTELFTNGVGDRGDRLRLEKKSSGETRLLGSWCLDTACHWIEHILRRELKKAARQS